MIILSVLAIVCSAIPFIVRRIQSNRQRLLLVNQLRQSLQNMVHALRIGVGLQQAIEYVAQEGEMPLAAEWRRLLQSISLGSSWEEALTDMAERVQLVEMDTFVTAVQITQSSGGTLADVLETLAETLQERQTLREKVSALTAQGKASGVVLAALPFLLLIALRILVPDLVRPMFTTMVGQSMIAGMILSVSVGGLVIWKIVHVKVD